MRGRSGATIRDVAARAGVSTATVSYVLNNRNRVAEVTRQKVLDAMGELSYYPSANARSLVRRKTNLIGLLIPHRPESVYLDPYFAELIRGVAIMSDAYRCNPVLLTVEGAEHAREIYDRIGRNDLVDGILMSYLSEHDTYLLREMAADGIPFVIIGSAAERKVTFVDVDNRGGAELAINHLAQRGHRAIGYINGPADSPHAKQRLHGFRGALLAGRIPAEQCPVVNGAFTREGGYAAMAHLLEGRNRPTAVFVASDLMAVGAMQCLHERSVQIPGDISLVGFDDTLFAVATYPTLTTVRQPIRQLGEMALDLLYKKIHDMPSPSSIILPTELIVRDSTGTAPLRD
jgi:DNA-binding LacI/PurR family transcriptional regulator